MSTASSLERNRAKFRYLASGKRHYHNHDPLKILGIMVESFYWLGERKLKVLMPDGTYRKDWAWNFTESTSRCTKCGCDLSKCESWRVVNGAELCNDCAGEELHRAIGEWMDNDPTMQEFFGNTPTDQSLG